MLRFTTDDTFPDVPAGDRGLPVLSDLGVAVEIEVDEVERFLVMEAIRFCNDDGVVFRLRTGTNAD
jgi:hypothetical protein